MLICVDKEQDATRIATLLHHEWPLVKVLCRAHDRRHAIELQNLGVDYQLREVFESALAFGRHAIAVLGATNEEADAITADVRERDHKRFALQVLGGNQAGADLLLSNATATAREQGVDTAKLQQQTLILGQVLKDGADTVDDGVQRVLGDEHRQGALLAEQDVKVSDERAAAAQGDAAVDDVGR